MEGSRKDTSGSGAYHPGLTKTLLSRGKMGNVLRWILTVGGSKGRASGSHGVSYFYQKYIFSQKSMCFRLIYASPTLFGIDQQILNSSDVYEITHKW